MGSIISVFFANGMNMDLLEKLFLHLKRKQWLDFTVPKLGFVIGDRAKEIIQLLTHRKQLQELAIPTAVVATDLRNGEPVVFREGPIADAVRASISIPGIFEPVEWNGRMLVDGGVIDRVPCSVVKEMGADLVIGVDVLPATNKVKIDSIFDVITQSLSIMERELLQQRMPIADVFVQPDCADISPTTFHRVEECIARGVEAMEGKIDQLKQLIAEWTGDMDEQQVP